MCVQSSHEWATRAHRVKLPAQRRARTIPSWNGPTPAASPPAHVRSAWRRVSSPLLPPVSVPPPATGVARVRRPVAGPLFFAPSAPLRHHQSSQLLLSLALGCGRGCGCGSQPAAYFFALFSRETLANGPAGSFTKASMAASCLAVKAASAASFASASSALILGENTKPGRATVRLTRRRKAATSSTANLSSGGSVGAECAASLAAAAVGGRSPARTPRGWAPSVIVRWRVSRQEEAHLRPQKRGDTFLTAVEHGERQRNA